MDGATFIYKEPFLCFAAEVFAEAFPQARFVHIIRDGRDTADSMARSYPHALSDQVLSSDVLSSLKVSEIGRWRTVDGFNIPWWVSEQDLSGFRTGDRYIRYLMLWKTMTERAMQLGNLGPSRYREVRYEDLVANPVEEGARIAGLLSLDVAPAYRNRLGKARSDSVGISRRNARGPRATDDVAVAGLLCRLGYDV